LSIEFIKLTSLAKLVLYMHNLRNEYGYIVDGHGSSVSHHQDPKRLWPDLPLIACGECKQKIVKEYRVKKRENQQGSYILQVSRP